jgi:uncharacterized membrane protein YeaQ/YmgE (transglycosylase-associated protein family)
MTTRAEVANELHHDRWAHWPVYWSAVWVGALSALAVALIFGLVGIAVGAHVSTPEHGIVSWHKFGIGTLIFSVVGAFVSFVVGGWVAGKIAGILHAEPAMLHGAIVWLVTIPIFLALASLGAGNYFGGWHGGLAGTPAWSTPAAATIYAAPDADASQTEKDLYRNDPVEYQRYMAAKVARNSALGAVTALLLGLVGSVIGGWMACGEPMTFTHYRTRQLRTPAAPEPRPLNQDILVNR